MPPDSPLRSAFTAGLLEVAPILLGVVPFGLIAGVTAVEIGIDALPAFAWSPLVFAGASQLAAIDLLGRDAAVAVIIATPLVINARFVMYSASLAPYLRRIPPLHKLAVAYLLTDQAYGVSIARITSREEPVGVRTAHYFGAGLGLWFTWQISSLVGVLVGVGVPAEWSLDFAIPLVFVALLFPAIRDRASVTAALAGAGVAVAAAGLPLNLGLLVGVTVGIGSGYWMASVE